MLLNALQLTVTTRQKQPPLDADTVAAFATVYNDIAREGEQLHPVIFKPNGKPRKLSEVHNLLRRFRLMPSCVSSPIPLSRFRTMFPNVPCVPKVKQKISGCFRTVMAANNLQHPLLS